MATKKEVGELLAGADGISVAQVGKDFEVGFAFSNTLVKKMQGIGGAAFDDAKNVWRVPAASVDALIATVGDMRDFSRQGGIQVKDVPGGKLVIFDYDKNVARLIGALDGSEFSRESGGWIVPAGSKASTAKDGQVSYLDKVLNDMRGIVQETRSTYEEILEASVLEAEKMGLKPGIHHPRPDHSYTGKIVVANAFWAAQLSGIDDGKGVAFITAHKQGELGQEVMQGDELRIDYDARRNVRVRTTEVFRQQQAEREQLTALAAEKMAGARVFNASTADGQYFGRVVEVGQHFALQHTGRENFVIHDLERVRGQMQPNATVDLKYKDGKGAVKEAAQSKGVER